MGLHVQQQVVFVLGLLAAHGTLELGIDAALEPDVPAEAVQPGVRVAAPGARVRRGRRRVGECRPPALHVPAATAAAAAVDPHPVGRGTCGGEHNVGTIKKQRKKHPFRWPATRRFGRQNVRYTFPPPRGEDGLTKGYGHLSPSRLPTTVASCGKFLPDAAEFLNESNFQTKKKKLNRHGGSRHQFKQKIIM